MGVGCGAGGGAEIYILYKLQNWKEDFAAFMAFCVLSLLFLDLEGRCLIFNII